MPMNTQAVIHHITQWLLSYSEASSTQGFVIGISGGIDSALTSTLCALTGKPLLCLEMPIHQEQNQVSRADEHIKWLQAKFPLVQRQEINLTPVYDAFVQANPEAAGWGHDMGMVNSRARLRMTTLYYQAQKHSYLVAGTGNKVEDFGVGFYTKYGDGGVDLSPIADLYKSEVYALARELGVANSILQAAPTDGLWGDDRTDEDQIGASYPELEWAMEFIAAHGDATKLEGRQAEVYAIYSKLNRINQHKMLPIPVCEIPAGLMT